MITMMTAPAGAEPDAVTLQIPAIPMTWNRRRSCSTRRSTHGGCSPARSTRPRRRLAMIQEILALPAHTRYIKAAGDEAMVCSAAMRETWPGRWHDLLRARVQDVIDALVSHGTGDPRHGPRHVRAHALALPVRQVRKRHDPTRTTFGMTVQELAR